MPFFAGNIEKLTESNRFFRRVIFTGHHTQLVLMSVPPGEEIGEETHRKSDQFFRIESGRATFVLNGHAIPTLGAGGAVVVPSGLRHNVINASKTKPLKLYALYSPSHHPPGVVDRTKADAIQAEAEKRRKAKR